MATTPHHLDGLIDLLVEAVLREMQTESDGAQPSQPRNEETAPPAKVNAALVDERNRRAKHTPITDDSKHPPVHAPPA